MTTATSSAADEQPRPDGGTVNRELTTQEWYAARGCTHAHCPFECGRCASDDGVFGEMLPCTPETCA